MEVVAAEEDLISPISPVTWENAEESSVLNLDSCAEWLRTTDSKAEMSKLGISVPAACLGLPRSINWQKCSVTV